MNLNTKLTLTHLGIAILVVEEDANHN